MRSAQGAWLSVLVGTVVLACSPFGASTLRPTLHGEFVATGRDSGTDTASGEQVILFKLTPAATKLLADYTAAHVRESFAIVVDGTVLTVPSIREPIRDGTGQIAGDWTDAEFGRLVALLRSPPLPVDLKEVRLAPTG